MREVNALFLIVCWRPRPSNMRPKMSAWAADVNAKITGLPRESQRALMSSESMLTRVVVVEFGLAMNENVRLIGAGAVGTLALAARPTTSVPVAPATVRLRAWPWPA